MKQETARFIVGVIGNGISLILFLAPMPTYWRMWKKKSTEEFHPYPYLATLMNCMFWILYGMPFVHPNSTLVVTINGFGFVLEILYLIFFFVFTTKKFRLIITSVVAGEIALFSAIVAITMLVFKEHEKQATYDKRSMFVGIICIIFGTIMYGSPLSILWKVIKTKSAEFLPIWLCFVGFLNGVCWFGYGFLMKPDPYLLVPNGLGAVLGFIQVSVYLCYRNSGPRKDGEDAKSVQLQKQNNQLPPV